MSKRYLSDLKLTEEQEEWVVEWLEKWGAWVRSGRLDKRQVNIIGGLMDSVIASDPSDPICSDDEGLMISQCVDQYLQRSDEELHFIVYGHYVNMMAVHRLATLLFDDIQPRIMQPCTGKRNMRKPCHKTIKRYVQARLDLANAIIHEMLVNGFTILRNIAKNPKNIKIRY